jgi:hypothetical protein
MKRRKRNFVTFAYIRVQSNRPNLVLIPENNQRMVVQRIGHPAPKMPCDSVKYVVEDSTKDLSPNFSSYTFHVYCTRRSLTSKLIPPKSISAFEPDYTRESTRNGGVITVSILATSQLGNTRVNTILTHSLARRR